MPLGLLIDECSFRRDLLHAIQDRAKRERVSVDFICVGDAGGPPRGTSDPALVEWSITLDRALVSDDKNTMIGHYYRIVETGCSPPPLMIRRSRAAVGATAEALVIAALVYGRSEYGRVFWLP